MYILILYFDLKWFGHTYFFMRMQLLIIVFDDLMRNKT